MSLRARVKNKHGLGRRLILLADINRTPSFYAPLINAFGSQPIAVCDTFPLIDDPLDTALDRVEAAMKQWGATGIIGDGFGGFLAWCLVCSREYFEMPLVLARPWPFGLQSSSLFRRAHRILSSKFFRCLPSRLFGFFSRIDCAPERRLRYLRAITEPLEVPDSLVPLLPLTQPLVLWGGMDFFDPQCLFKWMQMIPDAKCRLIPMADDRVLITKRSFANVVAFVNNRPLPVYYDEDHEIRDGVADEAPELIRRNRAEVHQQLALALDDPLVLKSHLVDI